jgi:hypothetical protein
MCLSGPIERVSGFVTVFTIGSQFCLVPTQLQDLRNRMASRQENKDTLRPD